MIGSIAMDDEDEMLIEMSLAMFVPSRVLGVGMMPEFSVSKKW